MLKDIHRRGDRGELRYMQHSGGNGVDWRKKLFVLNRSFHRDIGYFCVGLILIYAISGIAVNHIDSWNPSYVLTRSEQTVADLPANPESDEFEQALAKKLGITTAFRSRVRDSQEEVLSKYLWPFHGQGCQRLRSSGLDLRDSGFGHSHRLLLSLHLAYECCGTSISSFIKLNISSTCS